ncbi:MAG: NAD(P)/FAD-dependent oxidoreductase [Methylococcales bacterium]
MTRVPDVLVIGGGIAGLLCAREFVTAGYTTTVIEKQKAGREASWAGGGILFPIYPWNQSESIIRLWKESCAIYPNLVLDLRETTGLDPEWNPCGIAILDPGAEDALAWCARNAIRGCRMDPAAANSPIPGITGIGDSAGLWFPEIAQVRNPRLLAALQIDLKNKGVMLFENTEVLRFHLKDNRIYAVETNRRTFSAAEIVMAAGAWSKTLAGPFVPWPEITPIKGQMLLYKAKPGLLKAIVLYQDQYLIPRLDGHILAGSTLEHTGFDKTTTREARQGLDSFARRVFPSISRASLIDHWAGLRPGSASGLPYIGRHPVISNLSFNCGHFRNGIGMGPASARLLVDLVANREPCMAPQPYAVTRNR